MNVTSSIAAKSIFDEALGVDPDRRASFLDEACGADLAMRSLVDALLHAHEEADSFLSDLTRAVPLGAPVHHRAGDRIGRYRLIECIGEGGFGSVWKAEQEHPVRRIVALKIIKLGMDTRRVVARFEVERQALAMMDHTNIARVFDAGATESGRPYFAMEFVSGEEITAYCRRRELGRREVLDLFIRVCRAIEHAHQKGVVHRDIKPGNVLVTDVDGEPTVKVIDFGIAKATSVRLAEATVATELGQVIGTPQYMSPEQADLQEIDIDTRSDVYALGVLLFEMLTGVLPIRIGETGQVGYAAVLQAVREQPPTRPSAVRSDLRGDLETILLKTLQKHRDRRYQSAGDLAADVQRFLDNEPISARPPTAMYQLSTFARRHRALVSGAAVVGVVLVAGIVVSSLFAIGQSRARADAEQRTLDVEKAQLETERIAEAQRTMLSSIDAEAVGNELIAALHGRLDAESAPPELRDGIRSLLDGLVPADLARSILDRGWIEPASSAMEQDMADEPYIHAEMLTAMADIYRNLGQPDKAFPYAERAYERFCAARGKHDDYAISALGNIGVLVAEGGDFTRAEPYYRDALEQAEQFLGPDHRTTLAQLSNLAWLLVKLGQMDEANERTVEVAKRMRRVMGPEHEFTIITTQNAAVAFERMGRFDEAIRMHSEALAGAERAWGPDHALTLTIRHNRAVILQRQERYEEAIEAFRDIRERATKTLGREHRHTARACLDIGRTLAAQDHFEEALPWFEEAVEIRRVVHGPEHPETLKTQAGLGWCLGCLGRREEARTLLEETLRLQRALFDETHPSVQKTAEHLAELEERPGS